MIHSLGDSWCCYEGDTRLIRGWQDFALEPAARHGVPGTTAACWNTDKNGLLSTALTYINKDDNVIISLIGNDLRQAVADGNLENGEIFMAVQSLIGVVDKVKAKDAKVTLLLYADPFNGKDSAAKSGVALMRILLKGVAFMRQCDTLDTAEILTLPNHFDGYDIHPTEKGHRAIAEYINKTMR